MGQGMVELIPLVLLTWLLLFSKISLPNTRPCQPVVSNLEDLSKFSSHRDKTVRLSPVLCKQLNTCSVCLLL